jgi:hypothetical protein
MDKPQIKNQELLEFTGNQSIKEAYEVKEY